jgi:hypothetical protein
MELVEHTGSLHIDRALVLLIEQLMRAFPALQISVYLHGSWAAAASRATSDVDVLALARTDVSRDQRAAARTLGDRVAATTGVPIDLHLQPLDALIHDPWVDLRRTGWWIAGPDIRSLLPQPSLDALAREAVVIACLYATDIRKTEHLSWPFVHPDTSEASFGRLSDGGIRGLAKSLAWLTSARLASRYRYAPTSAADAIETFSASGDPFAPWLAHAIAVCRSDETERTDQERRNLETVCEETLAYENTTFEAIHKAVTETGILGERCATALDTYSDRK